MVEYWLVTLRCHWDVLQWNSSVKRDICLSWMLVLRFYIYIYICINLFFSWICSIFVSIQMSTLKQSTVLGRAMHFSCLGHDSFAACIWDVCCKSLARHLFLKLILRLFWQYRWTSILGIFACTEFSLKPKMLWICLHLDFEWEGWEWRLWYWWCWVYDCCIILADNENFNLF